MATKKPVSHTKKNGKALDVFGDIRPTTTTRKKAVAKTTAKFLSVEEQKKLVDEPFKAVGIEKLNVLAIDTSSFTFPDQVTKIEAPSYKCTCCGLNKSFENFYPSYSILHKQMAMMTICKECIDTLWKSYLIRYSGDLTRSLYYFCMLLDVPYFQNIMEEVKISESGIKFFSKYMSKIASFGKQNNMMTFLEGQLLFDGTNEKNPAFFEYDEDEVNYIPSLQDVKFWGKLAPQDIYFLKAQYEDWKNRCEIKDKGMEEVVKQICHKQLRIFRMNESNQNTSKEIKDMQDLMTSASLKPIQNKNVGTEENTLGNWIRRFENERPIPVPDPEFADVDGIWKKIRVWFLGHFSKIYNYENEYSREYEHEMARYRVDTKEDYETKRATHQLGKELFKND